MKPAGPGGLGDDLRRVARAVAKAHERFVTQGHLTDSVVRSVIAESWRRSADRGVDPATTTAAVVLGGSELEQAREAAAWAPALGLIRSLLTESAQSSGHVVALGDADGRLLWVEGDRGLRAQAEHMGFAEGALWSEEAAGTNAPGTALAIDQPVQIDTHEHFVGAVQKWSCTAVPIHDPVTGDAIGVIDVTGHDHVTTPMALSMVRATAAAVEQFLRFVPRTASTTSWRLDVLGRDRAELHRPAGATRLSARHSELLLLLALHPQGLTGDQIAVLLHEQDISLVTVRAELARLRRVLGPGALDSRPYRVAVHLVTDAQEVMEALDRGEVETALRRYRGPVLPSSQSPAIADLRADLRARIRRAALAGSDPDLLLAFSTKGDGADDVEVLQAALRALPPSSPKRLGVAARIERVNALFGIPGPRRR